MTNHHTNNRHGFSSSGLVLMLFCLSAAGVCWMKAPSSNIAAEAGLTSISASTQINTSKAIEQIDVGERVITPQTLPNSVLPTAVNPATWKRVSLQMETHYPGGLEDTMRVQTLQPPSWLAEHHVIVGARVPIPLDLKEMGVPEQLAQVTAVSTCPPIAVGPGRVVLTTVNHLNTFLFDLSVQGERAPPSLITVTGWHKLYSEDREAWVSACELKSGEKMRGREGPLTVTSVVRHPRIETVYNITVEGEHQYYVADARLLAHNLDCSPMNKEIKTGKAPRGIERADKGKIAFEQDHVHVNGGAINEDGTWKHVPDSGLTNAQRDWLTGWGVGGN